MRVALVYNPGAGDADHSDEALARTIESAGHTVARRSIHDPDWQQALEQPIDLVVSAGGDGTVRKVFRAVAGTDVAVTLLPLGSANNIARALGFHGDEVSRFVRGWDRGHRRPYRLGLFSARGSRESFVETVGGGLFAELLARADERDEDPGGEEDVVRGLELLRRIVTEAHALRWDIDVDGDELSRDLLALEVMNVAETGPNVPLSPRAEPGDGHLDLVLIGPEQRDEVIAYLDARLAGGDPHAPTFDLRSGRCFAVSPPAGCPLRLDDQLVDDQVSAATVTTGASLDVLVPALE
jgi:diacylglycerol kinase (ATP)